MLKHKYCRICMIVAAENRYFRIFETVKGNYLVSNILAECANISVELDDGLPEVVCPSCLDTLFEFWKFRKMIKVTNKNLVNMLCTKSIKEPDPEVRIKVTNMLENESEEENYISFLMRKLTDKPHKFVNIPGEADDLKLIVPEITLQQQAELAVETNVRIQLIEVLDLKSIEPNVVQTDTELSTIAPTNKPVQSRKRAKRYLENTPNNETPALHYCCTCPMKFGNEIELLEHVKTEHQQLRNRCGVKRFYEEEPKHRCDLCLDIINFDSLYLHRYRFKLAGQCESCGKYVIPKGARLKSSYTCSCHLLNNKKKKYLDCPICHLPFSNVKQHIKNVHDPDTFQCKLCPMVLTGLSAFSAHMQRHELKKQDKVKCKVPGCDFMLYERYRKRHMRSHTKEKPYKCHYCDEMFSEVTDKKRHEWTHTGISPYMCSKCNKMFFRKGHLLKHEVDCTCKSESESS